jgi:small subunit ribosomal protein S19
MTRSLFKGFFINNKLLKDALKAREYNKKQIFTRSRSSVITFDFLDLIVNVYNGKKYLPIKIREDMLGYKFGDFIFTKKKMIFRKKKKKKK